MAYSGNNAKKSVGSRYCDQVQLYRCMGGGMILKGFYLMEVEKSPGKRNNRIQSILIFFFNVYSFLRDRERQSMSGKGTERGRHRL